MAKLAVVSHRRICRRLSSLSAIAVAGLAVDVQYYGYGVVQLFCLIWRATNTIKTVAAEVQSVWATESAFT